MTYFITIAGRRWPVETTFRTGKDALGWDQSQARTWDAICRHTALTALAQLRTAAVRAALGGPAAEPPPAAQHAAPASTATGTDLRFCTGGAPLPVQAGQHCPPGIPPDRAVARRDRPHRTPRPRLEERAHHRRPPRVPPPLVRMAPPPPGPRSLAPLHRPPPGTPRRLTPAGRGEVTKCNQQPGTKRHAEPQRDHSSRNSNCNTSASWTRIRQICGRITVHDGGQKCILALQQARCHRAAQRTHNPALTVVATWGATARRSGRTWDEVPFRWRSTWSLNRPLAFAAWNGSWNEYPRISSAISASGVARRAVCAGSGVAARSRASRNA